MAANKTVGGINVTITATVDKFAKNISKARKLVGGFIKGIKNLVFSLKGLAAALAVGAFAKLVTNQMDAIDALAKTADKLNVTTEALAGLQLAADEAGVSQTVLEKGLLMLVRNTADASRGVGEAADAYKRLGLNAGELHRLSPDKQFRTIAEAISNVTNKQEQLSLTTEIFGARGASLITIIRGGSAVLDEAAVAAANLGLAVDRKTAAGVERAIDAFGRFKMAVSGIFRSLAAEIAPFIEVLSVKATSFLAAGGRGKGIGASIANAIIATAKFVADKVQAMVQAVLGFVADFKALILQFRISSFASGVGLGFQSADDKTAAYKGFDEARHAYGRSMRWEKPSTAIEKLVADARKQAAEQVAGAAGGGSLAGIASNLGKKLFGGEMGLGKQIGKGLLDAVQSAPASIRSGIAGAKMWAMTNPAFGAQPAMAAAATKGGAAPALSFAQSGSADSYRQQAAIRRQGESIQKKQLGVQEKMAVALASIDKKTGMAKEIGLA